MSIQDELKVLYAQMSEHTLPECQSTCRAPMACCSPEYCDEAIRWAKRRWGVKLEPTSHPRLPLMGESGCIAAPHLRPTSSVHTCQVNSFGFKPGDPEWTDRYFELRDAIDEKEYELEKVCPLPTD